VWALKVNGKTVSLEEPVKLKDFLLSSGYDLPKIAVELNGAIVPRASYDEVMLSPEDTLEIVSFVGGG
jgi:sulfur carrier protein